MIKKESYNLNTFAGLRVKEIQAKSDVTNWRHINSSDNHCSDILTRGASPEKLMPGTAWQCGVSWLVNPPDTWPVTVTTPDQSERAVIKSFERVTKALLTKNVTKPSSELHEGRGHEDVLVGDTTRNVGELPEGLQVESDKVPHADPSVFDEIIEN